MLVSAVGLLLPQFDETILHRVLGVGAHRQPLPRVEQKSRREFFETDPPVFIEVTVRHNHKGLRSDNDNRDGFCVKNFNKEVFTDPAVKAPPRPRQSVIFRLRGGTNVMFRDRSARMVLLKRNTPTPHAHGRPLSHSCDDWYRRIG